jgi:DNA-binding beta-propeller fold protein YncE
LLNPGLLFLIGASSLPAQPSVVGQWSAVENWPIVSVHTVALPSGEVLFYPYSDDIRLWNPSTSQVTSLSGIGNNPFCSAATVMADGRVLVVGGHISNNHGLPNARYYDRASNTWTPLPDMNDGRWYPVCTQLSNGDVLVVSGDRTNGGNNDLPQVWQAGSGTFRNLTGATLSLPLFPKMFLAPNGRVFFAGGTSRYLDTGGTGSWSVVASRVVGGRDNYGTAAMYDDGKIVFVGGADPPVASAEVINLRAPSPAWRLVGSMAQSRRQHNATLLPDGKVLVTGGSRGAGFNDSTSPVLSAELWDPVTEQFRTLASESRYRGYHSGAVLLLDGRVLSSGGDGEPNAQIFSPPYLFQGPRPQITSAPSAVNYNQTFFLGTPDAAVIAQVTWIRFSSVTHTHNMDQRIHRSLPVPAPGGLNVTAPSDPRVVPPGHYMLFLLDTSGVPSVARVVRISNFSAPPPAPTGLAGTPGPGQVSLTWNAAPTATSYTIKRSTTSGGPYAVVASGVQTAPYLDTGLTPGTTYYHVVTGVNPAGESPPSNQAATAPLSGGGGTGLVGRYHNNMDFTAFVLSRTDATVNFNWGTGSPDPALGADTFSVRWTGRIQALYAETHTFYTESDDGVRLWVNGQSIIDNWTDHSPTENSGTIALAAGQKVDIRMDFYENGGGAVARLSWASASMPKQVVPQGQLFPPDPPPGAPTDLVAVGGDRRVSLTWNPPASGATSYNLKRSTTSGGPYTTIATGITATSHNDTAVTNGVKYYYVVSGSNSGGEGPNSVEASATPVAPPAAPGGLTATPGDSLVALTWNPVSGADDYRVRRATTSGGPYAVVAFNVAATSFVDNGVTNGTTYYYVVAALNTAGEGPDSSEVSATPASPNQEPFISSFEVSASPVQVDTPVTFTVSASDADGDSLTYSFDFGDGSPQTPFTPANEAAHAYDAPGRYTVTGHATDGVSTVYESLVQVVRLPLTAGRPAASSQIIYDPSRGKVWNVNPDSDTVARTDGATLAKDFEVAVGTEPRGLALRPGQAEVWVVSEGSDEIHVVGAGNGAVLEALSLPRGARPMGIAFSPNGAAAYVTYMGLGRLARWDPVARAETGSLDVGPHPRAIAISADSTRIFIGRFISPVAPFDPSSEVGQVREVGAAAFAVTRLFTLAHDAGPDTESSGRGTPNYLVQMAISPDGQRLWVPSKKDNVDRGSFRDGLTPGQDSTVRSIISKLDLASQIEDTAGRLDVDDHELPHGVDFSPAGDLAFVAYQGNNEVRVFDAYTNATVAAISLGVERAPQDLVVTPDGSRLYVMNFMTRSVSAFDVAGLVQGTSSTAAPLGVIDTVQTELLPAQVLTGKRIFYNAADTRMTAQGYISCAVCHLDGGSDGRVWDFTNRGEGLRSNIQLQGKGGVGQGNVHWTGNFDEIQDFELDIRNAFGGTGFLNGAPNPSLGAPNAARSADLDALAAYVASLSGVGRSPQRNADGTLTADGTAGKLLYQELGCAACHSGPHFSDSKAGTTGLLLHDVGTIKQSSGGRLGQPLTGLDTPSLRGLWNTGPYLHDGSAATLLDVLTTQNPAGLHGATGTLTPLERDQLVAFLKQIDDDEPAAIPVPAAGLTATAGTGQISLSWQAVPGATSYRVKRSTVSGGPYAVIANVSSTSHTDPGLSAGVTYYYVVSSVNGGGEGFDSNEASAAPLNNWTVIAFDNFEAGFGNYSDGGADCSRYTGGTHAHQGAASADIQDNSGASSSFHLTASRNVTAFTQLRVTFWYKGVSMERGKDFFLEYSSNGGSTWQIIDDWRSGTEFSNNQWRQGTVVIDRGSFSFTTSARIRFRCDASNDSDDVYIDEIELAGR